MALDDDSYSNARFVDAGERAGYTYDASCQSGRTDDAAAMFSGRLAYESFSTGVSVYVSDMTSLIESEHDGLLDRSWTLAINLGEQQTTMKIGERDPLVLPPSGAKVVAVSDQLRMTNRVSPGQHCRSLLLTLSPGVVTDGELAEAIEAATSGTHFSSALMTARLRYLAACLAEPASSGAAGRLLNESRALELLAHVLGQTREAENLRSSGLSQRDRFALGRVRDVIHAAPNREFTLQGLATEAGMSLSSLKAKFPEAFGQTVFAYLRGVRLDYARDRIVHDGWTISQAAHFAGYRHVGNFSKAFRRRFGVRPVDVR